MPEDQETRFARIVAEQERLAQMACEDAGDDQQASTLVRRVLARLVSDAEHDTAPAALDSAVSAALCVADSRRAAPIRDLARARLAPPRSARMRLACAPVRRPQ